MKHIALLVLCLALLSACKGPLDDGYDNRPEGEAPRDSIQGLERESLIADDPEPGAR